MSFQAPPFDPLFVAALYKRANCGDKLARIRISLSAHARANFRKSQQRRAMSRERSTIAVVGEAAESEILIGEGSLASRGRKTEETIERLHRLNTGRRS